MTPVGGKEAGGGRSEEKRKAGDVPVEKESRRQRAEVA